MGHLTTKSGHLIKSGHHLSKGCPGGGVVLGADCTFCTASPLKILVTLSGLTDVLTCISPSSGTGLKLFSGSADGLSFCMTQSDSFPCAFSYRGPVGPIWKQYFGTACPGSPIDASTGIVAGLSIRSATTFGMVVNVDLPDGPYLFTHGHFLGESAASLAGAMDCLTSVTIANQITSAAYRSTGNMGAFGGNAIISFGGC